jgi:hypothetical protein
VNRTLQDRLVKELRLAGIATMDAGNAFPGFIDRFNTCFAVPPAAGRARHSALLSASALRRCFCNVGRVFCAKALSAGFVLDSASTLKTGISF